MKLSTHVELDFSDLKRLRQQELELLRLLDVVRLAINSHAGPYRPSEPSENIKELNPQGGKLHSVQQAIEKMPNVFNSLELAQEVRNIIPDISKATLKEGLRRAVNAKRIAVKQEGTQQKPNIYQKISPDVM